MTTALTTHFGFLIENTSLSWSVGHIEPLVNHATIVQQTLGSKRCYNGWFPPPLEPVARVKTETKEPPATHALAFSLPATHGLSLNHPAASDQMAGFLIALFGMLKGLRLQKEGWQHFYKCPLKTGNLCDFYATKAEIIKTMNLATNFWLKNSQNPEICKLIFSAIHWHIFAQLYAHSFEKFNNQYMALDTCWKLTTLIHSIRVRVSHADRAQKMATFLLESLALSNPRIIPAWASRRNDLVHESLYMGEPVGFVASQEGHELQRSLTSFVARCILGLLGVDNEYTRSSDESMQTKGFGAFKP